MNSCRFVFLTHLLVAVAGLSLVASTTRGADMAAPSSDAMMKQLAVGDAVPAVTLLTAESKPFDLRAEVMKKPAVLIFYRGGWCPYCNAHLAALAGIEKDLREAGFQLIAIGADQPSKLYNAPKRTAQPDYLLLSDQDMKAADAFGISYVVPDDMLGKLKGYGIDLEAASGRMHHKLPYPAVYIVDAKGVIQFVHVNPEYTKRLDPTKILEAAKHVATMSR